MHKSFNELLKDQKFSKAYNKVQAQKNNAAKTVMEEQYQFTIADKPVKIVQSENGTTYTLLINRAIDDANTFENLVIKYENDGSINATIINYQPFYPLNTMDYFTNSAFNGLQSVTPIVYNDALVSTTGKISSDCYSVCTILCHDLTESGPYSVPHPPGSSCTGYNITIDCVVTCWGDNIGGEDTGNDIGTVDNTSGGGTSSSTNSGNVSTPPNNCGNCNNPIETIPVLELGEEEEFQLKDPCEELKELLKSNDSIITYPVGENDTIKRPKLKPRFELIGGKVLLSTEYGCTFSYKKQGKIFSQGEIIAGETFSVALNIGGNIYGGIHCHPAVKAHSIPSFGDIDWVADCYAEAIIYNKERVFEVIAVRKLGSTTIPPEVTYYAFKVDDIIMLKQNIEDFIDNVTPTTLSRDEKINQINIEDGAVFDKNPNDLEKKFLEKYGNCGLSLYKANENLTNWGKLTLNTNGSVENNPCEN